MSDYLFGIGDFSRLTLLSVRMLRHYDQRGLLIPTEVDPFNGYRFYGVDQLQTASRIRMLRDIGCGIEQIAELLSLFENPVELRLALDRQAQALDAEAQRIADQQSLLLSIINSQENTMPITVQERDYPALRVLALRRTIASYNAESELWMDFTKFMQSPGAPAMSQFKGRFGATYFDPDYREADVDVAIWGEFEGDFEPQGDFQIIDFPAQTVAWATLVGPYEGTGAVCEAIGGWISQQGYQMSGPMFNVNIISPAQDPNPANWVTEINYPITK